MKTIDKKSALKFFVGVATGILLYVLTQSFWVILITILLIGFVDKIETKNERIFEK